eukprot:9467641-Pyramimonas_sp.AAC.1
MVASLTVTIDLFSQLGFTTAFLWEVEPHPLLTRRSRHAGLPGVSTAIPSTATTSELRTKWLQCKAICDLEVVEWEKVDWVDSPQDWVDSPQQNASVPPSAREGHAAAVCDSRFIAVLGGFAFSDSLKVRLFDAEADSGMQWSEEITPECTDDVFEGECNTQDTNLLHGLCGQGQYPNGKKQLVEGQRYGLSATTCRGLVDGQMQDVMVVFGGFTAGGYAGEVAKVVVLKWSRDP